MIKLSENIIHFLGRQNFVIVSTIDKAGTPHSACKGIVRINKDDSIYLLDLYKGKTFDNLKTNHHLSITAIDEHKFMGYCLKGKAKIVKRDRLSQKLLKDWEDRLTSRITQRILKNIRGEKGHSRHPESLLPRPAYMILMKINEIVDLTPGHLK